MSSDLIALYGAHGQIGSVLREHWGYSVATLDKGEDFPGAETIVWCATSPVPLEPFDPFAEDMIDFLNIVRMSRKATRLIFTSSFGIEAPDLKMLPYAAGKIAGEAFTHAWAIEKPGRSAVSVRMGGYGRLNPPGMPTTMSEEEICRVFDEALSAPLGYSVLRPLAARHVFKYQDGTRDGV